MLEKSIQSKRVPGPVEKSVLRSLRAQKFEDKETWGRELAIAYARQLDDAARVKREVLSTLDEADTASKYWHQRLERIEKYVVAETALGNIGPKLLALMKELGCTPVTVKTGREAGPSEHVKSDDDGEDELARLRNQRRTHQVGTGS